MRHGSNPTFSSFTDLINSQYGNWNVAVDNTAKSGITIVSGSSSPTAPQEHYVDGITLKINGVENFYDFVDEVVVVPNTPPVVVIESPTPVENSYVRGIITGRATATDDEGKGR